MTTNPFLSDDADAESVSNVVNDLITTSAFVVCSAPLLVQAWAKEALTGVVMHHPHDAMSMTRAILHTLREFFQAHSGEGTHIIDVVPSEHLPEYVLADPTVRLLVNAGPTWVRACIERDDTAADNVLKAVARELGPERAPDGYLTIAVGAVACAAHAMHGHE